MTDSTRFINNIATKKRGGSRSNPQFLGAITKFWEKELKIKGSGHLADVEREQVSQIITKTLTLNSLFPVL